MDSASSCSAPPPLFSPNQWSCPPANNLTTASSPASVSSHKETLPLPGSGGSFEVMLAKCMRQKENEIIARLHRYGRFGMTLEEARLPTPERYRKAYAELRRAIDRRRELSPSPECVVASLRKLNVKQAHRKRGVTTKRGRRCAVLLQFNNAC